MASFTSENFLDFIMKKHFDFCSIEEEMSDRLIEDEFNSDIAEQALDIAFDLYPDDQPGKDNDDLMDLRHEFVSSFMEYARSEVTKKWASNLGMITKEEAITRGNLQASEAVKHWKLKAERQYNDGFDDGVNETLKKHRKMSAYQFSAWKLGAKADDPDQDRIMEQVEDSIFYDEKYPDEERESMLDDSTPSEYQPQDSEDECWEQMRVMQQQANNNHSQDI